MGDRPVFDYVSGRRSDSGDEAGSSSEETRRPGSGRRFEPTRDGWRAYQAWCKQVREKWDANS